MQSLTACANHIRQYHKSAEQEFLDEEGERSLAVSIVDVGGRTCVQCLLCQHKCKGNRDFKKHIRTAECPHVLWCQQIRGDRDKRATEAAILDALSEREESDDEVSVATAGHPPKLTKQFANSETSSDETLDDNQVDTSVTVAGKSSKTSKFATKLFSILTLLFSMTLTGGPRHKRVRIDNSLVLSLVPVELQDRVRAMIHFGFHAHVLPSNDGKTHIVYSEPSSDSAIQSLVHKRMDSTLPARPAHCVKIDGSALRLVE
ncbi:hypothetical protein BGZ83_004832 [Gryganskiella cystojenkinii]|nr:hypothetical protein BGZ83_004832 [Gryganskiella cystojenkinii]